MIRTSAHLFEIASRFVSTEEKRYYLTGVLVEPHPCGGVNLAATDADLARPWRLALVDGPDKQERNAKIRRLRDVSEAQTLAAAYGVAA